MTVPVVVVPWFWQTVALVAGMKALVDAQIRYPVRGEPPSSADAVHDSPADIRPGVTTTAVGSDGAPNGVTGLDTDERSPVPAALMASAVK